MFRVESRFVGQGLWNSAAAPVSYQAAFGQARALDDGRFADDARIVSAGRPSPVSEHLVDRRV